ncbi:MAG: DNA/RNA nuclease SfsA [Clostridia bacterium]|nr:DNA/RNA nuclease SfsA [Clostridia bacterium]
MIYRNITKAVFIDRPNRFIAHVNSNGNIETVHVKNTGRCKELLLPGTEVWLTESDNALRKTAYDLVTVRKSNGVLFNIDSQAPNKVVSEWLNVRDFDRVVPEYKYGNSRVDFYMERGEERFLMEVKGCTLEAEGVGFFPDAPTERGVKHIREMIKAKKEGYHAILAFVIQMDGVTEVRANVKTHPEFGEALEDAKLAGIQILNMPCHVEPDSISAIYQDAL